MLYCPYLPLAWKNSLVYLIKQKISYMGTILKSKEIPTLRLL